LGRSGSFLVVTCRESSSSSNLIWIDATFTVVVVLLLRGLL
jgi:hypothetical protein